MSDRVSLLLLQPSYECIAKQVVAGAAVAVGVLHLGTPARADAGMSAIADPPPAVPPSATAPAVAGPVVVERVDAVYPPSALADRKQAEVVLTVTVDTEGHVPRVDVAESAGDDFDEAAMVAMRRWTFVPAMRGGKPVASRIRVPFRFAPPAPAPVLASTPLPASSPSAAATPGPAEVNVRGRAPPPSVGASDFNVSVGALAAVPHDDAASLLKLAPGILLTNEGGEGHAEQVFLRGFDAREGQDIEFTVGGVPINESGNLHGNGYADTNFIIPELVERLRVVEGPYDPRQGNYAVAGSADYELGLAQRGLTAKYKGGSFDTQRVLLLWGPQGESEHTFGGVDLYSTQGFGQNRDAQRASAMGQYEGRLGSQGSWRVTAQGYATHFHSAGLIRQDDYQSGKIGFYDSYDLQPYSHEAVPEGGDASRFSVAADLETRAGDTTFTQQIFVIKRDMRLLENFTGFLLDVQEPLQTIHAQRGDMLDLNVHEVTIGARGSATLHGTAFGQPQALELGYFARGDNAAGTQQRLEANTGVPYKTDTDLDSQLGDIALYADANLRAAPWLALRGGVRGDLLTYDVLNDCAAQSVAHPSTTNPPIDQSCLTQQDMGRPREPNQQTSTSSAAFLPRGALIVGPLEHFTLTASYGNGIRSIDPSYITQDIKTPFANIVAYEGGLQYAAGFEDVAFSARARCSSRPWSTRT